MRSPPARRSVVSSVIVDWCLAPRRWGFYLKSKSPNYPDHGHHGDPPTYKENSHVRAGNRTRDLVISSQKLWPLDHDAEVCQIVTTFGISWQIYIEVPMIKFHVNPSCGSRAETSWQTVGLTAWYHYSRRERSFTATGCVWKSETSLRSSCGVPDVFARLWPNFTEVC